LGSTQNSLVFKVSEGMQIFTSSLHLNGKYLNYLDHEEGIIKTMFYKPL